MLLNYDIVVSGVYHGGVRCDVCSAYPLRGLRWKCTVCYDYDLCHDCYMTDQHELSHPFFRYDTRQSIG